MEANTKYPILDLVNAFFSSELVKNDERLRTVCHFALRLSLPQALAGVFADSVAGQEPGMSNSKCIYPFNIEDEGCRRVYAVAPGRLEWVLLWPRHQVMADVGQLTAGRAGL